MKDKVLTWKLDHIGMDPSVESYLVIHRFGTYQIQGEERLLQRESFKYPNKLYIHSEFISL